MFAHGLLSSVAAVLLLYVSTATAHDNEIIAPFWDRVFADPSCDHKQDCGYPGITAEACHARGCCFDPKPHTQNWCSGVQRKCKSDGDCGGGGQSGHGKCNTTTGQCICARGWTGDYCNDTLITKVHVITSCHLDVGFTDSSAGVINKSLSEGLPRAIQAAQELRNNTALPDGWGLKFMAQSYYLSFYLDCPPNMGFACPTPAQQEAAREAMRRGDITWHAFPHNAELENTSPAMFLEGLRSTRTLDKALGQPYKRTLSQRDVPGLPRSAIPLLKANGVDMVSVGVNGASMYPRVPRIFRWQDPVSTQEVLAMWHPRGYGGYSKADAVTIPGFAEALVTDWVGDNGGPGDTKHYESVFGAIQKEFPNATVVVSTFDEWLDAVETSGLVPSLPVVTGEVGDSWIQGVPSDPKKTSQARALDRALTGYLADGGTRDAAFLNFSRLAIKNCEHTWGRDVKSNLRDNANWDNAGFEYQRTVGPNRDQYGILEQSWWEQRRWGVEYALEALPAGHDLLERARKELGDITQPVPYNHLDPASLRAAGFSQLNDPSTPVRGGDIEVAFNASTGAVAHLVDHRPQPPVTWSSTGRPVLELNYRTYSQEDFNIFQDQYANLTSPPDWFRRDFGKPNMTQTNHSVLPSSLAAAWSRTLPDRTEFLLSSSLVGAHGDRNFAHTQLGAPARFVTNLTVYHSAPSASSPRMEATLWCVNKTSTRLPEVMFVTFNPDNSSSSSSSWEMQKLGQWQRTDDVVPGGSQHLHGVSIGSGVRFNTSAASSLSLEAMDAPLINLGEPLGFPVPCTKMDEPWAYKPDMASYGVSSVLWNNVWGTNYPQWIPFNRNHTGVPGEENLIFRYRLRF